uniref:Uncharacterized protein n=1 Tax=Helianthus annuus TaxID=4232 RepID=A0A251S8T8_HELAN
MSSSSSTCIGFNNTQLQLLHHVRSRFHTLKVPDCSSTPLHFQFQSQLKHDQITQCLQLRCVRSDDPHGLSDPPSSSIEQEGSGEYNESQGKSSSSSEILEKLRRYGISGILSYGLLNTAYYLTAFLVAWFYIAPAPAKMGYWAAVKRFVKLMAMVWAGSQVTKLVRLGGALALAPVVDKGLTWFMAKFKFKSQATVRILQKLRRYGISGILSFYIAPAPAKMGYWAAVKRFVKLMAMVWAGSQVTKLVRLGGALALAPVVDKGLTWFMAKFKFKSQATAFTVIVGCCFGLAAVMFLVVTLLSA